MCPSCKHLTSEGNLQLHLSRGPWCFVWDEGLLGTHLKNCGANWIWSRFFVILIICTFLTQQRPRDKFMFMYKIVFRIKPGRLSKTCKQIQMGWSRIKSKSTSNTMKKNMGTSSVQTNQRGQPGACRHKGRESMRHRWREWAITEVWNLTWGTNRGSTRELDSEKKTQERNTEAETGFQVDWKFSRRSVKTDPLQAKWLRLRNDTFQAY